MYKSGVIGVGRDPASIVGGHHSMDLVVPQHADYQLGFLPAPHHCHNGRHWFSAARYSPVAIWG